MLGIARRVPGVFGTIAVGASLVVFGWGCTGERMGGTDSGGDEAEIRDSDGDSIIDVHEGGADSDGDGILDYQDLDSDGDLIPDEIEAGDSDLLTFPLDSDGDGLPDFIDLDSDNNGMPDVVELGVDPSKPVDLDGDGIEDFRDPDNDGDGIIDAVEMGPALPIDSDSDGIPDYLDTDSDGDTILDRDEARTDLLGMPRDTDLDLIPDYRDLDSDGDGFTDHQESGDSDTRSPPIDTDQDGHPDFVDLDSDGDGLEDAAEPDLGLDPLIYDSDGDGYSDGGELAAGSDASNPLSIPDGLYLVVPERSQTWAEFDFTAEIGRADVVFLLDSTGSMGPTLNALADDFLTVVSDVSEQIPDAAFGVVTFHDYNSPGMGGSSDKPFWLEQQVTTDRGRVQDVLSRLTAGGGGDLPETVLEALFQAASGVGFDQDCDGAYDSSTDVPPFLASEQDVFLGNVSGEYDSGDSSSGLLGGVGIRRYALPVFVYTTDAPFRDPDNGYPVAGLCGNAATRDMALTAIQNLGGKLIGINAGDDAGIAEEMKFLAEGTYSLADIDGDGELEPLVYSSKGGPEVVDAIVEGISAFHSTGEFQRVELQIEGDEWGFVADIDPLEYNGVVPGQTLGFSIRLFGAMPAQSDERFFELTLTVVGDGATRLDAQQILIAVPGA